MEKEGAVVKKLVDPKLLSQEAADMHWLMGHGEYRNCCEVCVKARGHEEKSGNTRESEVGRGYCQSTRGITASLETRCGTSGRC